jgi:hypothetical protein
MTRSTDPTRRINASGHTRIARLKVSIDPRVYEQATIVSTGRPAPSALEERLAQEVGAEEHGTVAVAEVD